MKLSRIINITDADIISETSTFSLERDIEYGLSCDLMSDVLMALRKQTIEVEFEESSILITGLATMQAIRTAEMLDIDIILFVRGKIPNQKVIDLAKESEITLLTTKHMMYRACGELFCAGLKGIS